MRKTLKALILCSFYGMLNPLMAQYTRENQRAAYEFKRLKDPSSGKIPDRIRSKELLFSSTIPQQPLALKSGIPDDFWKPLGPVNVGGRTRAMAIDVKDENHLISGGVTGGIWSSYDQGKNWTRVTTPLQSVALTCLVQDTRPGRSHIWYAGTGEASGSSASGQGAYYVGAGIWKSTDNGDSWQILPFTQGSSIFFDKDFELCYQIAINTADTTDNVFVATYSGIYRSLNGGSSFTRIRGGNDLFTGKSSYFTDLAITSNGVIYASLSAEGPQGGIWRSTNNGTQWTRITPAGWNAVYRRAVFGLFPQRDGFYLISNNESGGQETKDFRGRVEYHSLWKYEYLSGNGSGVGGKWTELSDKLPEPGTQFGRFISQGGYDLFIKVHPKDSMKVFLGGTNLWRNDDAFATKSNTYWIGGYEKYTSLPDFKMYQNHHPDQHLLLFFPSNPAHALSAHDGGISITQDILNDTLVKWQWLNQGYFTTQFYTLAMKEDSGSNEFLGGLQDNGTWYSPYYTSRDTTWNMPFSGDGSYCYFRSKQGSLLVSKQEGKVYHIKIDPQGNPVEYARIDPDSGRGYQFINPFIPDPIDDKRIFVAGGDRIWRNNNIEDIPLQQILDSVRTMKNWTEILGSVVIGTQISAITTDAYGNVLYGTENGKVYKIYNPWDSLPLIKLMGDGIFPAANTGCIHVSDKDTAEICVVFTNYGVNSLYHSTDGGNTWSVASSNLEENSNGTGNGPSLRWIDKLEGDGLQGWFLASSTGLYAADTLKGAATKWVLQGEANIGNVVCTMVKARKSDQRVVVVTHGNGIYSATFQKKHQILQFKPADVASDVTIYPNPATSHFEFMNIPSYFKGVTFLELYGLDGKWIKRWPLQQNGLYDLEGISSGTYFVVLNFEHMMTVKKIIVEK